MKIEVILKIIREKNQNQRIADIRENKSKGQKLWLWYAARKKMLAEKGKVRSYGSRCIKALGSQGTKESLEVLIAEGV